MKKTMITEFVEIRVSETTTVEQFTEKAENFNNFLKKQDGYIDGELVKAIEGDTWRFVFHFGNMEKIKVIGEKMRSSSEFNEFKSVIVPGSIGVTFFHLVKKW
jgi:antibiotic biosynthesis monooxygenase (ABM) superfamily enzyme